jgi:hypothetical protein
MYPALTDRIDQPRDTEGRVGAQFQRIAPGRIDAAQDRVDALETSQGLEVDASVARGQVGPLRESRTEFSRKGGVLGVGLVEGTGRQEHHTRIIRPRRRTGAQVGGPCLEEATETPRRLDREGFTHGACHRPTMMEGEGGAGRGLETIAHHPPPAIRTAREIGGVMLHEMTRRQRRPASACPQELRIAEDKPWRIAAFRQQCLGSMKIGEHAVEEQGALRDAPLDRAPFRSRKDQRYRVEDPGPRIRRSTPVRAFRAGGIKVERDPVILEMLAQSLAALRKS